MVSIVPQSSSFSSQDSLVETQNRSVGGKTSKSIHAPFQLYSKRSSFSEEINRHINISSIEASGSIPSFTKLPSSETAHSVENFNSSYKTHSQQIWILNFSSSQSTHFNLRKSEFFPEQNLGTSSSIPFQSADCNTKNCKPQGHFVSGFIPIQRKLAAPVIASQPMYCWLSSTPRKKFFSCNYDSVERSLIKACSNKWCHFWEANPSIHKNSDTFRSNDTLQTSHMMEWSLNNSFSNTTQSVNNLNIVTSSISKRDLNDSSSFLCEIFRIPRSYQRNSKMNQFYHQTSATQPFSKSLSVLSLQALGSTDPGVQNFRDYVSTYSKTLDSDEAQGISKHALPCLPTLQPSLMVHTYQTGFIIPQSVISHSLLPQDLLNDDSTDIFLKSNFRTSIIKQPSLTSSFSASGSQKLQITSLLHKSQYNRLIPDFNYHHIQPKNSLKCFSTCGYTVCTATAINLQIWDMRSGENHYFVNTFNNKIYSMTFRPSRYFEEEGKVLCCGLNDGQLWLVDVIQGKVVERNYSAHHHAVISITRDRNNLWSLDESGQLCYWSDQANRRKTLKPTVSLVKPKKFQIKASKSSIVLPIFTEIWVATNKHLDIYQPFPYSLSTFYAKGITIDEPNGEITCMIHDTKRSFVYTGHQNGKLIIWDVNLRLRIGVIQVAESKICGIAIIAEVFLWLAIDGTIHVYDISRRGIWTLIKKWTAHDCPIVSLEVDYCSLLRMRRLHVCTVGKDGRIKLWDGLMSKIWQYKELERRQKEYCEYTKMKILVCSWNINANKPEALNDSKHSTFLREWLTSIHEPDIIYVGFQEIVDLNSKKITAKTIFRKKDEGWEGITHRYKLWQGTLSKAIQQYIPTCDYQVIDSHSLIGLFSCIFIKSKERSRLRNNFASTMKTGFGGFHGNKGSVAIQFTVDDTSFCFVNCHLAAGQDQLSARNNDISTIIKKTTLKSHPMENIFVNGGDGSQIMDHQFCFISGDLNYRIDMPRESIEENIRRGKWNELLKYDQLYNMQEDTAPFILKRFYEAPILFAPTYKYDPGTSIYDTSNKRRSPAWCDRILYRGKSIQRIQFNDVSLASAI